MTIRLAKTAPWATPAEIAANPQLRNCYRERFAQVGDRYFKVSSDSLYGPWWVEEVDADGEQLVLSVDHSRPATERYEFGFGAWAMNLAEARTLIEEEAS